MGKAGTWYFKPPEGNIDHRLPQPGTGPQSPSKDTFVSILANWYLHKFALIVLKNSIILYSAACLFMMREISYATRTWTMSYLKIASSSDQCSNSTVILVLIRRQQLQTLELRADFWNKPEQDVLIKTKHRGMLSWRWMHQISLILRCKENLLNR